MEEKIQRSRDKGMREVWGRELWTCQVVRRQIRNFYQMEGKAKQTLAQTRLNCFILIVVERNS
jgi:hypothetical protein